MKLGKNLFIEDPDQINNLWILGENMEKSKREEVILNAYQGYQAYHRYDSWGTSYVKRDIIGKEWLF